MSAFDDEFGLFGEEAPSEEDERRSTLGARTIATGETVIDEIEPEDERPARRRGPGGFAESGTEQREGGRWPRRRTAAKRDPLPPEIGHPRAVELLTFLAKKLVSNPDAVVVELHPDARGAVLELEVDPEDIGKVIGRGGRVAQALRTLVRAGAEGRVTIDIVDADEDDDEEDFDEGVGGDDAADDALVEGEEAEDVRLEGPLRTDSEPTDYQEP
jgi:predicted RNA-binding protein YlqC (UPF0109 family)